MKNMFNLKDIISSIADVGQKLFKKKELKRNDLDKLVGGPPSAKTSFLNLTTSPPAQNERSPAPSIITQFIFSLISQELRCLFIS